MIIIDDLTRAPLVMQHQRSMVLAGKTGHKSSGYTNVTEFSAAFKTTNYKDKVVVLDIRVAVDQLIFIEFKQGVTIATGTLDTTPTNPNRMKPDVGGLEIYSTCSGVTGGVLLQQAVLVPGLFNWGPFVLESNTNYLITLTEANTLRFNGTVYFDWFFEDINPKLSII